MKKTKRGVTLVELIICCSIIVMLGGACSAVIASGSSIFNKSTSTAHAQMESDVFQTFMINILPSAKEMKSDTGTVTELENGLFINSDNDLIVRVDGTDTRIRSVRSLEFHVVPAGSGDSPSARAQMNYTLTFEDGSFIKSGFVLSNVKFSKVSESSQNGTLIFDSSLPENHFKYISFDKTEAAPTEPTT